MIKIGLKIPWGFKTKVKKNGLTLVKYKKEAKYRLRKKSNPRLVENNQHFGEIKTMLSKAYKALTPQEKEELNQRRIAEGTTNNNWIHFMREYYRTLD